jgi:hypothetical protein
MTEFSEQFRQYLNPGEPKIRDGITTGLIVLDTNVILSAYRFAPKARRELLNVLNLVRDRLWIPHQVGLEFHRNRFSVIVEHDTAYRTVIEALDVHRNTYEEDLERKIRELVNRAALSESEQMRLLNLLQNSLTPLATAVERLKENHGVGSPTSRDVILESLQQIFSNKVGNPFDEEESEVEKQEAARRVRDQIPPGYKDANKQEDHGDYFVWCQTLKEVRNRGAQMLVFVTGDVKDDWYLRVKGQTVMARPELVLECQEKTGATLLMFPTKSWLRYAESYLHAEVSDDTILQAEKIATVASADRAAKLQRLLEHDRTELERATLAAVKTRERLISLEEELATLKERERTGTDRLLALRSYIEAVDTPGGQRAVEKAKNELEELRAHLATIRAHRDQTLHRIGRLTSEVDYAELRQQAAAAKYEKIARSV